MDASEEKSADSDKVASPNQWVVASMAMHV